MASEPETPKHIPDELLGQYSQGTLEESMLREVEIHLLICEQCCDRLTEFDNAWGLNG